MFAQCASRPVVIDDQDPSPEQQRPSGNPVGTDTVMVFLDLSFMFSLAASTFGARTLQELSDQDIIIAAEKAGTFEFWNTPEDDIYNDLSR